MLRATLLAKGINPSLYWAWRSCHYRCNNPDNPDYQYYGGRGITVCKRWDSFAAFAEDMGPHPGKGWTLDRTNNNRGYSKRNCRWASRTTQSRNRGSYNTLSLTKVAEIRAQYIPGVNRHQPGNSALLAAKYGVCQRVIQDVIQRKMWV